MIAGLDWVERDQSTMSRAVEQWIERARYDIETAEVLLHNQRYLYVLFCCQQAVEKALKAVIAQRSREMPPRLHNLVLLADRAGIVLDEPRAALFRLLNGYYLNSRYPEELPREEANVGEPDAAGALEGSREVLRWLALMLE